jgi:hypothetical protein
MTKLLILLELFRLSLTSHADTWVNGYVKRYGTCFRGGYRQDSNGTNKDNLSVQYNRNHYLGTTGIWSPNQSSLAQSTECVEFFCSGITVPQFI